jgi:hypothetical protein
MNSLKGTVIALATSFLDGTLLSDERLLRNENFTEHNMHFFDPWTLPAGFRKLLF